MKRKRDLGLESEESSDNNDLNQNELYDGLNSPSYGELENLRQDSIPLSELEEANPFFAPFSPLYKDQIYKDQTESSSAANSDATVSTTVASTDSNIFLPPAMKNKEIYTTIMLEIAVNNGGRQTDIVSALKNKSLENISKKSSKNLNHYFKNLADWGFIKITEPVRKRGYYVELTEQGWLYLQQGAKNELPTNTLPKAPKPPKPKSTAPFDNAIKSWIATLKEANWCCYGHKKDNLIFDFKNQEENLTELNGKISTARGTAERGLNRIFKMGRYLVIFSKDNFSDLHTDLQNYLIKELKPDSFKSHFYEIKEIIGKYSNTFFGNLDKQTNFHSETRAAYYHTLKKYYRGVDDKPPEAFIKPPEDEAESVITEQLSNTEQFNSPLSLNREALDAMTRVGAQPVDNSSVTVQSMEPIQSLNEEEADRDFEIVYPLQQQFS